MKRIAASALLLALLLLSAGCLVQSVQPWLASNTCVAKPALLGTWYDANGKCAMFFTGTATNYAVLMVGDGTDVSRYSATLHRIDKTLLLMFGAQEGSLPDVTAAIPVHYLFKAKLSGNALKLYNINLDDFEARAEKAQMPLLPDGSRNNGYILAGTTADAEAFLRAQLPDPKFFDTKPLFTLRKLPDPDP